MVKHSILVNLVMCNGCWTCALACKVARNLAETEWWSKVTTNGKPDSTYTDDPAGSWSNPSTLKMSWTPIHLPKCDYCEFVRANKGLDPYCVYNCPTRAKTYGDLDDPGSKISLTMKNLRDRGYKIYQLPDAGDKTKQNVYYASRQ